MVDSTEKNAAKSFGKSMGERVVYVDVAALGEGFEHAWVGIDRVVVIMRGEASGRRNVTGITRLCKVLHVPIVCFAMQSAVGASVM